MTVSMTTGSLDRLQQLYDSGYTDRFVDTALRKIVERQITRVWQLIGSALSKVAHPCRDDDLTGVTTTTAQGNQ